MNTTKTRNPIARSLMLIGAVSAFMPEPVSIAPINYGLGSHLYTASRPRCSRSKYKPHVGRKQIAKRRAKMLATSQGSIA